MENSTHEQKMQQIEAECAQLRKQILQLEFQHKKDRAEFERRSQIWAQKSEQRKKEIDENLRQTDKNLRQMDKKLRHLSAHAAHLSKLTGIAFEELEDVDERLDNASFSLAGKRKKIE